MAIKYRDVEISELEPKLRKASSAQAELTYDFAYRTDRKYGSNVSKNFQVETRRTMKKCKHFASLKDAIS